MNPLKNLGSVAGARKRSRVSFPSAGIAERAEHGSKRHKWCYLKYKAFLWGLSLIVIGLGMEILARLFLD